MPNHYTHAKDIPYENWANIHDLEPDNYHLLSKDGKGCPRCSQIAYAKIQRSQIELFGYGEFYIRTINARRKLEQWEIKFAETKDQFYVTEINLAKIALEEILKNPPKQQSFWDLFTDLEEAIGYQLDAKKETLLSVQQRVKKLANRSKAREANEKAQTGVNGNRQPNYRNR